MKLKQKHGLDGNKNGETHRFHQQVGKQYSYEKGMAELSEIDQLKLELKRKED